MLRLRPYITDDAETILSWITDEKEFYKWTAGVLGQYPITAQQFDEVRNLMAFTAVDNDDVVGFFTLRRPGTSFDELRFGFVVVDPKLREQSIGKKMLILGMKYAKEIYSIKKITLGVFENNLPAYYCYKAAGFSDVVNYKPVSYRFFNEDWKCLELEYTCSNTEGDEKREAIGFILNNLVLCRGGYISKY